MRHQKLALATLLAFPAVMLNGVYAATASTQTGQGPATYVNCIHAGTTLYADQTIYSTGGAYRLTMESNGNLVEYNTNNTALWATMTNVPGSHLALQSTDGNLVIYTPAGHAVWAAYPPSSPGDWLCMQTDGNVTMYPSPAGPAIWATESGPVWKKGLLSGGNSYPYGQCTWYAEEQAAKYVGQYPYFGGDAHAWAANAAAHGWSVNSTPHIGSVVVFQPWTFGAYGLGHVAWVTGVYPATDSIRVTEMNFSGGAGHVDQRLISGIFGAKGVQYIALLP